MTQTLLDPRMLDTAQALPAMSGANLTGVSGAYSVIASGTVTSSSGTEGVEFTSLTHDIHVLDIWCVEAGSAAAIELHFSTDNGSTYLSGTYDNYFTQIYAKQTGSATTQYGNTNVENSLVGPSVASTMSNNGTGSAMITVTFDRNKGGTHIPYGHAICAWEPAGYAPGINVVGFKANLSAGNDIDAMKVMLSTGIWDKFKYRLIGYSI